MTHLCIQFQVRRNERELGDENWWSFPPILEKTKPRKANKLGFVDRNSNFFSHETRESQGQRKSWRRFRAPETVFTQVTSRIRKALTSKNDSDDKENRSDGLELQRPSLCKSTPKKRPAVVDRDYLKDNENRNDILELKKSLCAKAFKDACGFDR